MSAIAPTRPELPYLAPDYDIGGNNTRQTLNGCVSMGFGTVAEAKIAAFVYDFEAPSVTRFEIDRMIRRFRDGEVSQSEVLQLIEQYNDSR